MHKIHDINKYAVIKSATYTEDIESGWEEGRTET